MAILAIKIKDQRFLQLIRKALNAGYLIENRPIYDMVGTAQNSIISPILANIYLHQLDEFVEDLKLKFDIKERQITKAKRLDDMVSMGSMGSMVSMVSMVREMKNKPNKFISSKKLMYVRYVDN